MSELPADPATSAAGSMSDDTDQGGIISQPPGCPPTTSSPTWTVYRAIAAMMVVVTHVAFQTKYIYAGPVGAVLEPLRLRCHPFLPDLRVPSLSTLGPGRASPEVADLR